MAELRLGPLLRYVDGSSATVWVETSRPCTAEVRCSDGTGGETPTFQIAGHYYALVPVDGLAPGTERSYEVFLDGTRVWPLPDAPFSGFPPSVIHTPAATDTVRVAFGSCRWAAPRRATRTPWAPTPWTPWRPVSPPSRRANGRTSSCCWATRSTPTRPPGPPRAGWPHAAI